MSFPRYERYKDSGVEWLGQAPEHWAIYPGRRVFEQKRDPSLPDDQQLSATQKFGVIPQTLFMELEGQKVVLALKGTDAFKHVEENDFIISLRSFQGGIEKSHYRGCVSTAYTVLRDAKPIIPQYWEYLFKSSAYIGALSSVTDGIREGRSISYAQFGALELPLPSIPEQGCIASVLDTETRKIDALIEEQQRLIELLKEKRQAVISHAVTKGLNPHAVMCDTQHKWIGRIPVSWSITRVKYAVATVVDCLHTTPTYDGELLYPAIRTADVEPGRLLLSQARLVSEDVYSERVQRLEPEAGDILYSREGERFGMAALVPSSTKLCLGQRMMMFRPNSSFAPGYLMWAMNSSAVYQQVLEGVTGPTAPHVNIGEVINFLIPMPDLAEQKRISKHIYTVVTQIDDLVAHALDGIELLQERRSALISAAVTGKIDVRVYMAKPVVSATQYSSGFAHQLLAAEILDRCNSQRMGRIKLQKLIHLCEYHGQVSEVQGDYSRKAAGPFDARAMAGISKNLKKQKWFEEVREGERYVYRPLEKRGEHKKYLAHWQAEMPRVDEVLSLLGAFKTRECEIVSTLYAAWNDLLIDGGSTDDAAILHEASSAERWHKSKEQIAPERWMKALQWMKDKGLVPVGYGKHTRRNAGQSGTTTEEAHDPA